MLNRLLARLVVFFFVFGIMLAVSFAAGLVR